MNAIVIHKQPEFATRVEAVRMAAFAPLPDACLYGPDEQRLAAQRAYLARLPTPGEAAALALTVGDAAAENASLCPARGDRSDRRISELPAGRCRDLCQN